MNTRVAVSSVSLERGKLALFALFGVAFLALAVPASIELMTFWTGIVFGGYEYPTHELHHFVLGGVFSALLLGVLAQAYRPSERVGALHSAIIIATAITVAFAIGGEFSPMYLVLVGLLLGMALTHPAGATQVPSFDAFDRRMGGLAAVTAIAAVAFAGIELSSHLDAGDAHVEYGHYLFMATTALSVAGLTLLGSVRGIGWRYPVYAAAFFMLVIGLGSIVYPGPEQGSSLGVLLGAVVVCWGLLFVIVAERGENLPTVFGS